MPPLMRGSGAATVASRPAEPYDVCVIGSGPAGAFVAHELVAAGARVVLVEAGEAVTPGVSSHLPPSAFKHRGSWEERQAPYYPDDIAREVRYQTPAISVDRIRVLGGRSVHWNAVCLRFAPDDFREKSVAGIEADWPISYDDLDPYYAYVERTIGVCGTRENLAVLPDGEFSGPPPPLRCAEQIAAVACRHAGLRLIPTRKALQVRRGGLRVPCHYCGRCMLGCDVGAIFTTPNTLLPPALATGRLTLRKNALARQLLVGTDGLVRAAAVVDRKTKGEEEIRARRFVVSCGSIESARLLLNSACERHPNGLANSSDLVGRYLTGHAVGNLYGYLSQLAGPRGRLGERGALDHSYIPRSAVAAGGRYVGGFGAQVQYADLDFPHHASRVRGFGAAFKAEVKRLQPALLQMGGFAKVIAQPANRVTVEASRPDRYGIPSPAVQFEFGDNDRALFADMMDRLSAIYEKAGTEMFFREDRLGGLASHETGTCRMGADPRTSVLNAFCRAHDVANLFVVDGSPFVTLPEKNPTLTIMALAVRTARYIADAGKRGDP
jgi:choline dehydrogenase-like flavoprotein